MPLELKYFPEESYLYCSLHGELTLQDLRLFFEEVTHSNEYSPDVPAIWDLTNGDYGNYDYSFAFTSLELSKDYPERTHARIAVVVNSALGFGLSRMYDSISDELGHTRKIFDSLEAAKKWLLNKPDQKLESDTKE
jgi:hypothetical protein